jgi:hypothetical protein
MSGFVKRKVGTVEIEHYSSSSNIKITFTHEVEIDISGNTEKVVTEQWFDYAEFSDLKKACNQTDDWL